MNQSLYNIGKVPSPLCTACSHQEETPEHVIFQCSAVDESLRARATLAYRQANHLSEEVDVPDAYIGLLNASKDEDFLIVCTDIISSLNLRTTVEL